MRHLSVSDGSFYDKVFEGLFQLEVKRNVYRLPIDSWGAGTHQNHYDRTFDPFIPPDRFGR